LLLAQNGKKQYSARSNAAGQATLQVPVGDTYMVTLKALTDTTIYSTIEIPAPQPGQFYTSPFKLTIEYDPGRLFTLNNVEYDVNKATLRPQSFKALDELVEYLKWRNTEMVEIAGHTDNTGPAADNLKLSQQRAEAVRNYLVKKGVAASRIVAKGYGLTQPIADNQTARGRQQNRRTEARFL
jgi:OmpA-OmpF porin, OOP family